MKQVLLTLAMLLTLSMGLQAAGQKHRHTPQEELADSTSKDAVEVYSDTTSVDTVYHSSKSQVTVTTRTSPWSTKSMTYDVDDDFFSNLMQDVFGEVGPTSMASMFFGLAVLFLLFVLAPVIILIVIFYFINKNRKEKIRLAQMAVQQGQPIPDKLLDDSTSVNDEYQKGLRQCFVGVGLMIFLGLTAKEVGFGIGALVFCIGLGKIVAAKMAEKKNDNIK